MKKVLFFSIALLSFGATWAQGKYFTKTGKIYFNATAKLEKVEATNRAVIAVIDTKTGNIQFAVMLKAFEFEKALMQEHFNENYVESDKFPKAEFIGQLVNNAEINYSKDGIYPAKVKGKLTLHGVTKDVEAAGKIIVKGGTLSLSSDFNILLSDFKVEIPGLVKENISNETKISIDCLMEPLKG
ncbi:MAG: YceI family protein [Bacteroidetes bacterium]|jgi:polyisoprenoid-binding protein YceI|nr:YceI family protein [Bacteroidota bacterium]